MRDVEVITTYKSNAMWASPWPIENAIDRSIVAVSSEDYALLEAHSGLGGFRSMHREVDADLPIEPPESFVASRVFQIRIELENKAPK